MAKYRKKSVIIEAEQWLGQEMECVCDNPKCEDMRRYAGTKDFQGHILPHIHTLEGKHIVQHGDWIITGVKGEKYPCKPDIFEQTYELVR